jgi:hypothetical protein
LDDLERTECEDLQWSGFERCSALWWDPNLKLGSGARQGVTGLACYYWFCSCSCYVSQINFHVISLGLLLLLLL